ncbi:MAG: transcriptional repressor LexA [Armatimonadetes bacterium]|nr:transcriptional repressor LexA [Armatimonadota bacterium]
MAKTLSARQRRILEYIKQHSDEKGYPPTVREIGEAVGLRSSSTVHGHLKSLEAHGHILRDAALTRAIRMPETEPFTTHLRNMVTLPLVGRVAAGLPILAEENVEERYTLPQELVPGGEGCFMLRIKGDSMIEDGILDGDLVIVRPQNTADNGETVVGLLGDEATVKRFYRETGRVRLQPANSSMAPIYADEVTILGRVVGVVRRMA